MGGAAGGGGTSIAPRDPAEEKKTVGNWYDFQQGQLFDYIKNNPLLQQANTQALGYSQQAGGLIDPLTAYFKNLPSIDPMFNQVAGLTGSLQAGTNYLGDIIENKGALTKQGERDVAQATRTAASQYGTGRQLGTLGTELLNRDSAQQQRYGWAQGLYQNAASSIAGLNAAAQGLRSTDIAQRTGLAGSVQNLQSGNLNQLLGVQQGNVGTFSQLQNPILSYLGNLFSNNLQGRIAQAQVNQQGNIASDNKTSDLIGGAISSIGSIAGAAAMSDERMKMNIRDTGVKTIEDIPLKSWEYITRPGVRFISPLAQDVEAKLPDHVLTDPVSGVKFVTGFPVIQISPPQRKAA